MDPKKPGEFWKVVNRAKSNNSKVVIQPIEKEDGSLAVSGEEILTERKKRCGKESLDVKAHNEDWFHSVEQEIKNISTVQLRRQQLKIIGTNKIVDMKTVT